jgi:UDP-glucose 4-epimerase
VLGGGGFVGSSLVKALLATGQSVRIYGRKPSPHLSCLPGCEEVVADFSDVGQLLTALHHVDTVYHLISTTVPSTSNQDPVHDVETNLVNTIKLVSLMQLAAVKRIVFLSSGGTVYGVADEVPISEDHPISPLCSYGIVKHAIERYLLMHGESGSLEPLILRASNPYGTDQRKLGLQGIIATFLHKITRRQPLQVWGDGSVRRDFIYIDDLVDICLLAGESGATGVFNVGSGKSHSICELIEIIGDVLQVKPEVNYLPARNFDVPDNLLDIARVTNTFDWQPRYELREGIAACVQDDASV